MEYEIGEIVNRLVSLTDSENNERTLSVRFNFNVETSRADIVVRKERRLTFDPQAESRRLNAIQRNGRTSF